MQPGVRRSFEPRARPATVFESTHGPAHSELEWGGARHTGAPERGPRPKQQCWPKRDKSARKNAGDIICHNCSGLGHLQKNCHSPRQPKQQAYIVSMSQAPDPATVVTCTKSQEDEMCVQILIQGLELCALLDSGARRNVLPLYHFNTLPTEFRPPIQPSVAQILQGIGPGGLAVLGEVVLPVHIGGRVTDVNFIMVDAAGSTKVILGHPFL